MSFAGAIVGLIPYVGKPAQGIARAIRVGTKAAIKKALKAAMKQISRKLIKKAKKNQRKYVKKRGKEMVKETAEAILEGGAEELAASAVEEAYPNLKQELEDLAAAVDPTGIADIVQSFAAEGCSGLKAEAMPEDGVVDEMRLAETGVLHYVNNCQLCGINICADHSLRLETSDDSIMNFQFGDDTDRWGCSRFQASEYSVIQHGINLYVVEEDGVTARSHKYTFAGEGQCQSGWLAGEFLWNLESCKRKCDAKWNCKYFSFWKSRGTSRAYPQQYYCSLHSSCTSFDSDPAFTWQKGGTLFRHMGEGYCKGYKRIWSGRSKGPDDCRTKCEGNSKCKYFSYWGSKWCINWETCGSDSSLQVDPRTSYHDTYEKISR